MNAAAANLIAPAAEVAAAADQRIAVIDDSLKCLLYGALACVPFLGALFLLSAVRSFRAARRNPAPWNPARRPLAAGLALASVGWLVNLASWWIPICSFAKATYLDQWIAEESLLHFLPGVLAVGFPVTLAGWIMALCALRRSRAPAALPAN